MRFSDIIGQERAKGFLKRVMGERKVPHAYLFTGIPGIGKTSMATALTMALNCHEPGDLDGCGNCPSCRRLVGGNFPDFILIRPDGQNIKIEQIRELNRRLGFAPVSASFRVCVLQQAETMTSEAANSFLKTLEEPPAGNILILSAREPLDLLPTIVSRCQRVPFQPLPTRAMVDWLVSQRGLDRQKAEVAARGAAGSLGTALRICDENFLEMRKEWLSALLKLPAISIGEAVEMAFQWTRKNRHLRGGDGEPGGSVLMDMLHVWGSWYRDLLLVKVGGPGDLIINVDFSDRMGPVTKCFRRAALVESLLVVSQAVRDLRRMRNAALVLERAVLHLKRLARTG